MTDAPSQRPEASPRDPRPRRDRLGRRRRVHRRRQRRPFEKLRLHWWGAALVGLALQGIPSASGVSESIGWAILIASYGLLIAFAWINRRLPAAWLVIAGLALNLLVIGVNDGMPVSASALETAAPAPTGSSARAP